MISLFQRTVRTVRTISNWKMVKTTLPNTQIAFHLSRKMYFCSQKDVKKNVSEEQLKEDGKKFYKYQVEKIIEL